MSEPPEIQTREWTNRLTGETRPVPERRLRHRPPPTASSGRRPAARGAPGLCQATCPNCANTRVLSDPQPEFVFPVWTPFQGKPASEPEMGPDARERQLQDFVRELRQGSGRQGPNEAPPQTELGMCVRVPIGAWEWVPYASSRVGFGSRMVASCSVIHSSASSFV